MPQISSSCGFEHALWILRSEDICFHRAEKFKNILHFRGKKINVVCIIKQYIKCARMRTHNSVDEAGCHQSTFED